MRKHKKLVGIIGTPSASNQVYHTAVELGKLLIDNEYRIICGGLSGVMEAVSLGGTKSKKHSDGDIIGILPGFSKSDANKYIDIVIPSGFGFARNLIIVTAADIVVAIGGGSGTLSEISFAWQFQKPIIGLNFQPNNTPAEKINSLSNSDFKKSIGWSSVLGGLKLDETRDDKIWSAETPEEVISLIKKLLDLEEDKEKKKLRYQ